ncbi:hypothetical protein EZY14_006635 [Kordia sp. TARA_039_SRF]|nr:hypothetical protein EZY14_006635 [Kordia sp. TARA_039_SRF]
MKNIFKILILSVIVTFTSCVSDDDSRFQSDPTSGWVEFSGAETELTPFATTGSLSIPLDINVPIYENGFNITYSVEPVSGDFAAIELAAPGTLFIDPAISNRIQSIDLGFNPANITENVVFDVTITNADNGIGVGIDSVSNTTHRVTIFCTINTSVTGIYDANVVAEDLGLTNDNNAPFAFVTTLTPVEDGPENTSWTVSTGWGPNFVALLTGNGAFSGLFLYPGTLTLDPETKEVVYETDDEDLPGGEGFYDSCTDTFTIVLEQDLFTGDFTVTATFVGQ